MLLRNLDLLTSDPARFLLITVIVSVALLVGITVHEFSHALVSWRLGDSTAQRLGRLSLNPVRHLDTVGTLMILVAGFGWGKPVPVDPSRLRGNPRSAMALVSLAGPFSNIITAFLLGGLFRTGIISYTPFLPGSPTADPAALLSIVVLMTISLNLILAVFNLLPLWPLDGFKVVLGLLPTDPARSFARLQPYGPVILLGVIFLDLALGLGILSAVLGPPIDFLGRLVLG